MKILILSGSARQESFNAKLAELAIAHAKGKGVDVDYATGAQLRELPMFDQLDLICKAVNAEYERRGASLFISGEGCGN